MKPRLCGTVCVYAFSIFSVTANAVPVSGQGTWETTLQGRDLDGNNLTAEAYYDTALDITWLANADINGEMDWFAANTRAGGLISTALPAVSPQWQADTPRYGAAGKPGIQRRPGAGGRPQPCPGSGHPSGLVLRIGVRHDGRA